jgi:hypothetical protein
VRVVGGTAPSAVADAPAKPRNDHG